MTIKANLTVSNGGEQDGEDARRRAEIVRIMQEEQREDGERIRRDLEVAMRDAENARVLSEELRKIAEIAREAAECLRKDCDESRALVDRASVMLTEQSATIATMQQRIRALEALTN